MYYILIIFLIILLLKQISGIKGKTIRETHKEIIKNDINKVADRILYYQNNNIKDIKVLIQCLKKDNKENQSWLDQRFNWKNINNNFYLPSDMKITEENNEIVIYYRNLIYNVNQGKYII